MCGTIDSKSWPSAPKPCSQITLALAGPFFGSTSTQGRYCLLIGGSYINQLILLECLTVHSLRYGAQGSGWQFLIAAHAVLPTSRLLLLLCALNFQRRFRL